MSAAIGHGRWERRLRRAWRGAPGPSLRAAEVIFGIGVDLRRFLYDAGLAASKRPGVPVLSVGGLTVGGSGKTPLTAQLGRWLGRRGLAVAIVTPGFEDEMSVHRALNPEADVFGARDRAVAIRAAETAGAQVVLLDDGFQHLRITPRLHLLLVDADALVRANRRRLPAGPFRDRIGELARADVCVVAGRARDTGPARSIQRWLERRLRRPIARCAIQPGAVIAANRAARGRPEPRPSVALAGVMKPRIFFDRLSERLPEVRSHEVLSDHATLGAAAIERLSERAGSGGIVTTLKDSVRLAGRLPSEIPVWYLEDRIEWKTGREMVQRRALAAVGHMEARDDGDDR